MRHMIQQQCVALVFVHEVEPKRVAMSAARDVGSSAARRRRERRLRSFLRHERMAVAMAVAEARHHSSRGQTTAIPISEVEEQ